MKIKNTMRYYCPLSRMSEILKSVNIKCWQGSEATRIVIYWWVELQIVMPSPENSLAGSVKAKYVYNS